MISRGANLLHMDNVRIVNIVYNNYDVDTFNNV